MGILVVKVHGFREVNCAVEDGLSFFADALLAGSNLVVKVTGDRGLAKFGDLVRSDAPTLNAIDPVVNGKLATFLLDKLLKVKSLNIVGVQPPVVLNANDFTERFVFWEYTVDALQVNLVRLKDFDEAVNAAQIPPSVLLHDKEAAAQNVAHIATSSDVGGQGTVRDSDQNSASVIQYNVKVFNGLNAAFNLIDGFAHNLSELAP